MDRPELTRIEPLFHSRIWGARALAPLFPEKTALSEPIGEAWLTGRDCRVATGPYSGLTLQRAWEKMTLLWRGTRHARSEEFPLLIKFIFPQDKLSIQVHPGDAYAAEHERAAGGRGKTEMWHAVSAEAGARVLLGLKPGTNKENFLEALAAQTIQDLFESWPVRAGDTFFVPAGTPHTIGPGMVLCEVQEYSDLTYRVYDYARVDASGRPRELHIEKALEVMNFGEPSGGKVSPLALPAAGINRSLLAACRYFAAERWEFAEAAELYANSESFQIIVVLNGSGRFDGMDGSADYQRGETWLAPAAIGPTRFVPGEPTTLLIAYMPDLATLRKELRGEGIQEGAEAGVVFE